MEQKGKAGRKAQVYDPVRRKYVALTPEEHVRQFVIRFLHTECGVPLGHISVENPMQLYERNFRTDLQVRDRQGEAVMVIECKRPEVKIDSRVLDQAIRYNMVLEVKYIIITNGVSTYICRRGEGCGYEFVSHVPTYEEMLGIHTDNADIR